MVTTNTERQAERYRRMCWVLNTILENPESGKDIIRIFEEVHHGEGDDDEKLKEKDELFVAHLRQARAALKDPSLFYLPRGTFALFTIVLDLFEDIEQILWELKGLPGDPPKSTDPAPAPVT